MRRSIKALVVVVVMALAAIGFMATADNSSAAARLRSVVTSHNYVQATCQVGIDSLVPVAGMVKGHIGAQAQPTNLGFLVTSTTVNCWAYDASSNLIGSYSVTRGSAYVQATRKNFTWAVSSGYQVCGQAIATISGGAVLPTPLKCSAVV